MGPVAPMVRVKRMTTKQRRAKRARLPQVCVQCGTTEGLTVDHKLALCLGGTNDDDNLQMLCRPCNQHKGTRECLEMERLPGNGSTQYCRGRRRYNTHWACYQAITSKRAHAFPVKCSQCSHYHFSA
jgi:hypothetical protein